MRTTTAPDEGNRIRLSVEVDEAEVNEAVQATQRRLTRSVKIPGFRPGRVPIPVLEAHMGGPGSLRREAVRDMLPDLYAQAVAEADLDPIAAPEIDVKSGESGGPLAFQAVVEVRPVASVPGYQGLVVTVPSPVVGEEALEKEIDGLRAQYGELATVGRRAREGDHVTIDIHAHRNTEVVDALTQSDLVYEVGSASVAPGLDEELLGKQAGDVLQFNVTLGAPLAGTSPQETGDPATGQGEAGQGDPASSGEVSGEVTLRVLVKEVRELVLPDLDDAWVADATEFSTVEELRADLRGTLERIARLRATFALRDGAIEALSGLVDMDLPDAMVRQEMAERIRELGHRLEHRNASVEDYLAALGQDAAGFEARLREAAERSVRADLALRALADAESLEVTDDDIDAECARLGEQMGRGASEVRREVERAGRLSELRSELRKSKALDWLVRHVEVVDEAGQAVDSERLLGEGVLGEGVPGEGVPGEGDSDDGASSSQAGGSQEDAESPGASDASTGASDAGPDGASDAEDSEEELT